MEDGSPWRATGREPPVFFDPRGRRGVVVRSLGVVGSLAIAGALTLIVIGAIAFVHIAPRLAHGPDGIFARGAARRTWVGARADAVQKLHSADRRHEFVVQRSRAGALADRREDLKNRLARA